MKRLTFAAALCAVALSACTPATIDSAGSIPAKADEIVLTGERAFGAAEVAYTTAADAADALARAGVIRGATANKVRGWNALARAALVRGKAATDAAERARAAVQLLTIAADLTNLAGSR